MRELFLICCVCCAGSGVVYVIGSFNSVTRMNAESDAAEQMAERSHKQYHQHRRELGEELPSLSDRSE